MRLILASCLSVLSLPAAAQSVNCYTATAQIELTFCAEQDWMAADADLNAAYAAAQAAMKAVDANLPVSLRGASVALRDAQRAWIPFRDAACAAEGYQMRGGSAEPMVIYGCRARVTQTRAADLWTLAEAY